MTVFANHLLSLLNFLLTARCPARFLRDERGGVTFRLTPRAQLRQLEAGVHTHKTQTTIGIGGVMTIHCSTCRKTVDLSPQDQNALELERLQALEKKRSLRIVCTQCHWASLSPVAYA